MKNLSEDSRISPLYSLYSYLAMECHRYKVKLIAPQTLEQLEASMQVLAREKRKSLSLMFEEAEFEIGEKQRFVES